MVGQVQIDPRGMQSAGRGDPGSQSMGGMVGPPMRSGQGSHGSPCDLMMGPYSKGGLIQPPRSPRMKAAPSTIISPSVLQINTDGVDLTSVSNQPDNTGPALARLGKSIGLSVEMLATVGESIGDENPDIRGDMLKACRESRVHGVALEKLCESLSLSVNISAFTSSGLHHAHGGSSSQKQTIINHHSNLGSGGGVLVPTSGTVPVPSSNAEVSAMVAGGDCSDLEALIRTLRQLLTAVTKILLLADNVVVKQLLGIHSQIMCQQCSYNYLVKCIYLVPNIYLYNI